jgi:hypothetical protein
MELSLLIFVGGCAGLIGLAAGFWMCDADNKELKKAAAASMREVEERAQAQLRDNECAAAQKIAQLELQLNQLTAVLADRGQRDRTANEEPRGGEMKARQKDCRQEGARASITGWKQM